MDGVLFTSAQETGAPASITVVRRPNGEPAVETDRQDMATPVQESEWEWRDLRWELPRRPSQRKTEIVHIPATAVPDCVHAFVHSVASIPGARCVVVEDGEDDSIHITTFLEGASYEIREQVYNIEGETIRNNPDFVFDFHVRRAEEAAGSPESMAGKHYYAVWGDLDAIGK